MLYTQVIGAVCMCIADSYSAQTMSRQKIIVKVTLNLIGLKREKEIRIQTAK